MRPGLQPGDWLLADPEAYRERAPRPGDLVLVSDPRDPMRLLVKRITAVDPQGWLLVSGDAPEASTDSRDFGPVDPATLDGQPWFRYWPLRRIGRVR